MIVKKSKIQFDDLVVLQSNLKFISPKKANPNDFNVDALMKKYVIDVDFGFREAENGTYIFSKISINENEDHLDGYQIFVEGCAFVGENYIKNIDKAHIKDIIYVPGLNILINQLRAYILTLTAYAPFGKYFLPAIDLADLLRLKSEEITEMKVKQESPSKRVKKKRS